LWYSEYVGLAPGNGRCRVFCIVQRNERFREDGYRLTLSVNDSIRGAILKWR
jgi:hypothetical protein